eukprot:gene4831-5463_t
MMRNNGYRPLSEPHDICSLCYDSRDFRTLSCGHSFCIGCLVSCRNINNDQLLCPLDRRLEETAPEDLPTPINFTGTLFPSTIFDEDEQRRPTSLDSLMDDQIRLRRATIDDLRQVAEVMKTRERQCAGAKIGGSVGGQACKMCCFHMQGGSDRTTTEKLEVLHNSPEGCRLQLTKKS